MPQSTRDELLGLMAEAKACVQEGRLDRAEDIAGGILAALPDTVQALDLLARLRLQQRNPAEALSLANRGLALSPDHAALGKIAERAGIELARLAQVQAQAVAMASAEALIAEGNFPAAADALLAALDDGGIPPPRRYLTLLAESGCLDRALVQIEGRAGLDDFARSLLRADVLQAAGDVEAALTIAEGLARGHPFRSEPVQRAMQWSGFLCRPTASADWAERLAGLLTGAELVKQAATIATRLDLAGRPDRAAEVRRDACAVSMTLAAGLGAAAACSLHLYRFDLEGAEAAILHLAASPAERDALMAQVAGARQRTEFMPVLDRLDRYAEPEAPDLTLCLRCSDNLGLSAVDPVAEYEVAVLAFASAFRLATDAGLRVRVVGGGRGAALPLSLAGNPHVLSHHTTGCSGSLHLKMGPLTGTLLLDRRGYAGWATAADLSLADLPLDEIDADPALNWMEAERQARSGANASKYRQPERRAREPAEPSVLVALQMPADTVMELAWVDMFTLARSVVGAFRGTGITVLVKRHPICRNPRTTALLRELADAPHVRITSASIHDLLPAALAVYTVNSGVGAEALVYGRSVHVAGKVDYRHACHELHDASDIVASGAAFVPRLDRTAMARYLWWYRHVNHVPLDVPGALDAALDRLLIQPALRRRQDIWRSDQPGHHRPDVPDLAR